MFTSYMSNTKPLKSRKHLELNHSNSMVLPDYTYWSENSNNLAMFVFGI